MPNQRLELTWIGKGEKPAVEPRILLHDASRDYGDPSAENMLIHGDNLLALKALEQQYTGQVKCIYIDPPYNTGSAFEHYDDNLEHSIWLGLMKARLEILQRLLAGDGCIFVHIDNSEQAYLKVLMDEVFGRRNFITTFSVKVRHTERMLKGDKDIHDVIEYIHFYRKSADFLIRKRSKAVSGEEALAEYQWNVEITGTGTEILLGGRRCRVYRPGEYALRRLPPSEKNFKKINIRGGLREGNSSGRFYVAHLEGRIEEDGYNVLYQVPDMGDDYLGSRYFIARESEKKKNGHYLQGVPLTRSASKELPYPSYFDFEAAFNRLGYEGVVEFRNSKKPEALIQLMLEIANTKAGDLVLDSFLGSGTTAAVAHKMGLRYIGIEMGDHCYTHCKPRLDQVVDGEQGGISEAVGWRGGGGYKFYELAPTLIVRDKYGNPVFSDRYSAEMLVNAVAKVNGYRYAPDRETFWKQGVSQDGSYIYVTTEYFTTALLDGIAREMNGWERLLVCAPAFDVGLNRRYENITVRKLLDSVLKKCEYGMDNYNLNIVDPPEMDEEVWEDA